MDIFGFQSRKVHECFEKKYVILLMVLISCAWTQDEIPSFNVTCNSTGLYVKIAFSKPFDGIVYTKGYRFDPLCSMTESSVLEGSLSLPLASCGTHVQETNYSLITNTIVIQQHPLIRTVNDLEKSIVCSLPGSFVNFLDPYFLLDQIYESHSLPPTELASDIHLRSDVLNEDSGTTFDYSFTRLTIFQLSNGTIYNDVGIKSCIAHNAGILVDRASVHQITNSDGCFTVDSENSDLTIIETKEGLTAYVEMKKLAMESSDSFYLTCEVILCKTKCSCSDMDQQQTGHLTSVISHKITKRSTDSNSEVLSAKKYEGRTRFLKSTVKALMDRIVAQKKKRDELKVKKRVMRLDDSSLLSETNSLGSRPVIASAGIFSPMPVSKEIYNREPNIIDVYKDYDQDDYHQDYDSEDSHLEDFHQGREPDDSHHNYREEHSPTAGLKVRKRLMRLDDSSLLSEADSLGSRPVVSSAGIFSPVPVSTEIYKIEPHIVDDYNDYDHEESHQDFHQDYDPDDPNHDHREEEYTTTDLSTVDSDIVITLSREFKGNGTEIVSGKDLQGKNETVLSNDVVSSVKEAGENINTAVSTISNVPAVIEISSDHLGSCVPRIRFVIVIVILGFCIGCLLLVSCGMALYIRKEKKRNRLNDFLLYSIGF